MRILITVLVFGIVLLSCGSGKSKASPEQIETLNHMVESKHYEIKSNTAYPRVTPAFNSVNSVFIKQGNSANRISLASNDNYLRIKGDSVFAKLPYFGERQMNVGYNGSDATVLIDALLEDYKAEFDTESNTQHISFSTKSENEILSFNVVLFPNLSSSINMNGQTRFPIRYSGYVTKL